MPIRGAAREHIEHLARSNQLGFLPERVGSWWERAAEVDVVAVSEADGALLLGEGSNLAPARCTFCTCFRGSSGVE